MEQAEGCGPRKCASWEAVATHPGPEKCQWTEKAVLERQEERGLPKEILAETAAAAEDGDKAERGNL